VRGFAGHCLNHSATPPNESPVTRARASLPVAPDMPDWRTARSYTPDVDKPTICPECGSREIRKTTRALGIYGDVTAFVCGVCDWASDPRMGRPPADRSKNITLRRLLNQQDGSDTTSDTTEETEE